MHSWPSLSPVVLHDLPVPEASASIVTRQEYRLHVCCSCFGFKGALHPGWQKTAM